MIVQVSPREESGKGFSGYQPLEAIRVDFPASCDIHFEGNKMRGQRIPVFLAVIPILMFGMTMTLAAQDQINLGDGIVNAHFNGNTTAVVTLLIPSTNCSGGECYLAQGSASGTGHLQSSGSYTVYSASSAPFYLTHNPDDSFKITQTSQINFSYTSQKGTLTGLLSFASISSTNPQLISTMIGTLTSPGGSFAKYFPNGAKVTIAVGLTFPLQTLYTVNGFTPVEFQNGTVVPASYCGNNDHHYWKNNPGQWQCGKGLTIGGIHYSDNDVENLLQMSGDNDASIYLAHRLIAAMLNVNNGSKGDPVQTFVDDANNLLSLGKLPLQINPSSAVGQQMLGDAAILDSFNNNNISTASSH